MLGAFIRIGLCGALATAVDPYTNDSRLMGKARNHNPDDFTFVDTWEIGEFQRSRSDEVRSMRIIVFMLSSYGLTART